MRPKQGRTVESINYSFVPNHRETMKALAYARFTTEQFRVVIALLNQTDGYLREKDVISASFWQALTFMGRQSVHRALQGLVKHGVVGKDGTQYWLKPPNDWSVTVFRPQQFAQRAGPLAVKILQKERTPDKYQWLDQLLKASLTRDDKAKKRRSPETMGKPSLTRDGRDPKPSLTRDGASLTRDGLNPPKESTKESIVLKRATAAMFSGNYLLLFSPSELAEMAKRFPAIDLKWESSKCWDWHSSHRRGLKNHRGSFRRWLEKARPAEPPRRWGALSPPPPDVTGDAIAESWERATRGGALWCPDDVP